MGTRWLRAALVPLGAGALLLGGGALFFRSLEAQITYQPSREIQMTPLDLGIPYEEVRLKSSDGESIAGWFLPADAPQATILFLHGNGGNRCHRVHDVAGLRRTGFSVLIIDYRGYGESSGSPSEEGISRDARAAWDHMTVQRRISPQQIVLYGESLGSAVALDLALQQKRAGGGLPGAIILVGAFTSAREMGQSILPFLPVRWLVRARMDNLASVREVDSPTLFIHGDRDEIVPIEMGRRLHEASAARLKRIYEVPEARHNTLMAHAKEIHNAIREFVTDALAGGGS